MDSVSGKSQGVDRLNQGGYGPGREEKVYRRRGNQKGYHERLSNPKDDAHHQTRPDLSGGGLARAIRAALDDAGLAPGDVGAISAHGTGTPYNDRMEAAAFAGVFGERDCPPFHCAKPVTGHTLGAAGAIDAVVSMEMLRRRVVPPSYAPSEDDPDLPVTPTRSAVKLPAHAVALSIAEIDLQLPIIPEIIVTIGGTPTAPYATPGTEELPESIRELVRCSDTLIMKNHGAVTLGANLMDAFKKLDMVEHTARILWLAHCVRGGIDPLPADAVKKLLETRGAG